MGSVLVPLVYGEKIVGKLGKIFISNRSIQAYPRALYMTVYLIYFIRHNFLFLCLRA